MITDKDSQSAQSAVQSNSVVAMVTDQDSQSAQSAVQSNSVMAMSTSQGTVESPRNEKRPRQQRSDIWKYFERRHWPPNDNAKWAVCLLCQDK